MKSERGKENKVYDFFDSVRSGELGILDIENYIESITDGFNLIKLKLLLKDVEYCLFVGKEEKEAEFSKEDILRAIDELSKQKKDIPYITFPDIKNEAGEIISEASKILDLERLLFPYEFYPVYELKKRINHHIKKASQAKHTEPRTETPQREDEHKNLLLEMKGMENKFWKGLPMEQVVAHFEVMTKKRSKNGAYFLTLEQLVSFLKRGFLSDNNQPKQTINCATSEKGFVIKRFYQLFDLAVSKYNHPSRKKEFVALFIKCFDNWDQKTVEAFFRPNKTKQNW